MGYLEIPFFMIKSPELGQIIQQIQFAVNALDETNFPQKLDASRILKANSISKTLIRDRAVSMRKLEWLEIPIALVIPVQPATTTTSLDCGGFFLYDPVKFPGEGTWYLEAAMKVSDGAATATAQLKNEDTVIGEVSTNSTVWNVKRSSALTMPSSQAALTVTLKCSDSTKTAYLWAARLIYAT